MRNNVEGFLYLLAKSWAAEILTQKDGLDHATWCNLTYTLIMGQKNVDMLWVNFIRGPNRETALECEAVIMHGQKSKIGDVFAQV